MLEKLVPPRGTAADFEDQTFQVGTIRLADARMVCLFNWQEQPLTISFRLPAPSRVSDYWSGEALGLHQGMFTVKDMPAHSAKLLVCKG
jgi:alpha-galactosidase